jgi:protein TonB
MSSALYEFMPYGAPELIEGASRRLFRATTAGTTFFVLLFLVVIGGMIVWPRPTVQDRVVVIPFRELAAPPPLTDKAPPPEIVVSQAIAAPAVGVPVPVPDVQAPPDQTIASQQEMAAVTTGTTEGSGQTPVVEAPPAEEMPKLGDFVYVDELPALVTDALPAYPPMARDAQVEGEVALRVLVGKDGRIAEVHIDQSIPMLDQAAIEAARKWVFKPALCNNRPVVVWVARTVRFSLTTHPS